MELERVRVLEVRGDWVRLQFLDAPIRPHDPEFEDADQGWRHVESVIELRAEPES